MQLHIANATIYLSQPIPGELMQLTVRDGAADTVSRGLTSGEVHSARSTPAPESTPALGAVWPGQGGILVATIPAMLGMPARHLIASTAETRRKWGPYEHEVPGAGSHVDGIANTRALLADGEAHPAAQWAGAYDADGHEDFFLPSRFDLLMAYLQAPQVFEKEGWYWSSTQASRLGAFAQAFEHGCSYWYGKDYEFRVRAFRQIPLTT